MLGQLAFKIGKQSKLSLSLFLVLPCKVKVIVQLDTTYAEIDQGNGCHCGWLTLRAKISAWIIATETLTPVNTINMSLWLTDTYRNKYVPVVDWYLTQQICPCGWPILTGKVSAWVAVVKTLTLVSIIDVTVFACPTQILSAAWTALASFQS